MMAVFFLLIGLELERELYNGDLSSLRNALLPIFAAFGGICVPALIHFYFNRGLETQVVGRRADIDAISRDRVGDRSRAGRGGIRRRPAQPGRAGALPLSVVTA